MATSPVTVKLPTALARYAGNQRLLETRARNVGDALRSVCRAFPDLETRLFAEGGRIHPHLMIVVGGDEVVAEEVDTTAVSDGASIAVLIAVSGGADDVRMRGFRERVTVERAHEAALSGVTVLGPEEVLLDEAAGRVLAEPAVSSVDVPGFRRATMDGYAVLASDTFAATPYNPISIRLLGSSMPGSENQPGIEPGAALRIMTGAPVPAGADAVLRAEDAQERAGLVEALAPVAEGKNIGRVGEDIERGHTVLEAGRILQPQDVGLLASIGHVPVTVVRRPRVRIVVSGDELLAPGLLPSGNSIVDSNSPMLAALVRRDGGVPEVVRLPDDEDAMRAALVGHDADVIITAGAASVGSEDRVPLLVDELGELIVHGVAMRPSSPTGVGRIAGAPVLILPGNPVSCLVAYDFFAGPVVRRMGGLAEEWPYRSVTRPLGRRLVSQIGRTDYARVTVEGGKVFPLAISGASVLSSVTRASGFVVVPAGLEGYAEEVEVEVNLYGGVDG